MRKQVGRWILAAGVVAAIGVLGQIRLVEWRDTGLRVTEVRVEAVADGGAELVATCEAFSADGGDRAVVVSDRHGPVTTAHRQTLSEVRTLALGACKRAHRVE